MQNWVDWRVRLPSDSSSRSTKYFLRRARYFYYSCSYCICDNKKS